MLRRWSGPINNPTGASKLQVVAQGLLLTRFEVAMGNALGFIQIEAHGVAATVTSTKTQYSNFTNIEIHERSLNCNCCSS